MLRRLDLRGRAADLTTGLPRPAAASDPPIDAVRAIIREVREGGDRALRELTARFDKVEIDELAVPPEEWDAALASLPPLLREALEAARANVAAYHRAQKPEDTRYERDGVVVREVMRPVDRAGLYVPGGRAVYPSTVIMTAVPARVAGVGELVLCVPPGPDGNVPTPTLAAAALAGVDRVYRVGGAQAVAAMAYGTESVPAVDVIVGPGNIYVSLAKQEVAGVVGIPNGFAGPSEVVVVADDTTPVDYAAVDVVVQAEHGPDGLAWLVTWSEATADAVTAAVERLVSEAPRREEIESTLRDGGYAVVVDGPEEAMAVANAIAPEHLQLMNADPDLLLPLVRSAGAVFTGAHAPASVGDYIAGPSHVLPTYGTARFTGGLGVDDFLKKVHVVTLDQATLGRLAPHVAAIADAEGLSAHAASVRIRWVP
ncbi:MAG TPA: histidinol dehydrogenase [Acidimicrobiales bacterium]|nr:histidinol dehydrogenase [Acidimicrobiales bacterium]